MKFFYKPTFLKDLKNLKGSAVYDRIYKLVFIEAPQWQRAETQPGTKRLNAKDAFRIRVGDYRIGFFFDGETITFARVLHRREIYRFFP